MSSPPHTQRAAAIARLPTELQYWSDNLPPGHGRYNPMYLFLLAPRCAWIGKTGAQMDNNGARTDGYCQPYYYMGSLSSFHFSLAPRCAQTDKAGTQMQRISIWID